MKHAVVFVDHQDALVINPDGTASEPEGHVHAHRPTWRKDGHRPAIDRHAVDVLCERVKDAQEILIVGPGTAKHELKSWLEEHHPDTNRRVVGVEAVDHPTSGELKNVARVAFRRIDAWL